MHHIGYIVNKEQQQEWKFTLPLHDMDHHIIHKDRRFISHLAVPLHHYSLVFIYIYIIKMNNHICKPCSDVVSGHYFYLFSYQPLGGSFDVVQ